MKLITINIDDYQPHPQNPNTHPDKQVHELQRSLEEFDQVKNVVVWQKNFLAGHGIVEAARREGRTHLEAVDVSPWPEEKAIRFMIADNRLPQLSAMDNELLFSLLSGMNPSDIPGIDENYFEALAAAIEVPDFEPASPDEQGRLDKKKPVTCPECGHEFIVKD